MSEATNRVMASSHHWSPIFVMSHNDVVVAANSSLLPVIHPPTRLPHHMEKSKARREKIKDQLDSCDARHLVFLSYAYLHLNVVTWMTKAEKNGEISSTFMSTVVAYRRFHDLCCWSWRTPQHSWDAQEFCMWVLKGPADRGPGWRSIRKASIVDIREHLHSTT